MTALARKKYEYLYHIADAKFRAYGSTIEEAFENAALAMFNVMIDTEKLLMQESRQVNIESPEMETLLIDWLSELLYLFEVEEIVFAKFSVNRIEKTDSGFSLSGSASGESLDLSRHKFDTQVKAVTYHGLEIKKDDGFSVQVIVDT